MNQSLKITIAADSRLSKLIIKDGYLRVTGMTDILINAPKIKVLEFFSSTRRTYFIENDAPAVDEARLSFDEMFAEATIRMIYPYGTERKLEGLLENFQAAKELHLCGMCIQFLTLQKLMNQENLQFNLKRLLLDTGLRKRELPGIAFLLNACPQLEQLVIIFLNRQPEFQFTTDLVRNNNFVEACYWGNQGSSVAGCVKILASVEFRDSWGSYQTWDSGKFQLDKFFTGRENG